MIDCTRCVSCSQLHIILSPGGREKIDEFSQRAHVLFVRVSFFVSVRLPTKYSSCGKENSIFELTLPSVCIQTLSRADGICTTGRRENHESGGIRCYTREKRLSKNNI